MPTTITSRINKRFSNLGAFLHHNNFKKLGNKKSPGFFYIKKNIQQKMNTKAKASIEQIQQKWVGYRENLKVLDCTIRDGGLMNDSNFEDAIVKAVYDTICAAGVDYMEFGYKNSDKIYSKDKYGAWRFCKEDDIKRIVGDKAPNSPKLCAMADAEKSERKDILKKKDSPLDMIRVATYIYQVPLALEMIKDAQDKGYETTVNLMAVSTVREQELDDALQLLCASKPNAIYLVDSFGSLYGEQIAYLLKKYSKFAKQYGVEVGIHAHNNLQLAFANTIEGIIRGATLLDATIAGLGRGAGNCPLEALLGFLHNPKYNIRPVLECIEKHIEPLRKKLGWGYDYPYMITGLLNRHPRDAMKLCETGHRHEIVDFYDSMTSQ